MTTLNTIIEEEKKGFDGRMTSIDKYGGFYHGNKSGVELYNFDNIKTFLTTAMQRAYEAGRAERDTYWKERVEELYKKWDGKADSRLLGEIERIVNELPTRWTNSASLQKRMKINGEPSQEWMNGFNEALKDVRGGIFARCCELRQEIERQEDEHGRRDEATADRLSEAEKMYASLTPITNEDNLK